MLPGRLTRADTAAYTAQHLCALAAMHPPTHPRQQVERQLHAPAPLLNQHGQPRDPAAGAQHRPRGAPRQVEAAARAPPLRRCRLSGAAVQGVY